MSGTRGYFFFLDNFVGWLVCELRVILLGEKQVLNVI